LLNMRSMRYSYKSIIEWLTKRTARLFGCLLLYYFITVVQTLIVVIACVMQQKNGTTRDSKLWLLSEQLAV